ncbi:MAG TPA: TMEM175 family protein [Dermatophilaceae bacterium]
MNENPGTDIVTEVDERLEEDRRTPRGLDRLVNFSDATVAIAITLLILPLVDVANQVSTHPAREVLQSHAATLAGFAITFALIGRFWLIHHRVFELFDGYTSALVRVNLFWLCCIVFLPFAANLLSSSPGDDPLTHGIYIGTILVTNASMGLMEWMILRGPHLLHPDCEEQLGLFQSVLTTGLLLVALLLAVLVPAVNMYALFLIFAGRPIGILRNRRLSRKRT